MAEEGASNNERMLAAARSDNEEMINEVFEQEGTYDVNFQDGLGNTALHYAAANGSVSVLEPILEQEVDVDLQNRIEGNTPLHLACRLEHEELRHHIVESLLEAGADPRVPNKDGDKPADTVSGSTPAGEELRKMLRKAEAEAGIDMRDVADDDDDDEDDGPPSDDE